VAAGAAVGVVDAAAFPKILGVAGFLPAPPNSAAAALAGADGGVAEAAVSLKMPPAFGAESVSFEVLPPPELPAPENEKTAPAVVLGALLVSPVNENDAVMVGDAR